MPSGDGFLVTPAELRTHAGTLETVGERVDQARASAASAVSDRQAYGMLCSFVPAMFEPGQRAETDALDRVATRLRASAGTLRRAATDYETFDAAMAAAYDGLGGTTSTAGPVAGSR